MPQEIEAEKKTEVTKKGVGEMNKRRRDFVPLSTSARNWAFHMDHGVERSLQSFKRSVSITCLSECPPTLVTHTHLVNSQTLKENCLFTDALARGSFDKDE